MNALTVLDETVHHSPEDKLYQHVASVAKRLPDDPVTQNLITSVLAAAKFGHRESTLERIQRCKAALRSAVSNAQTTLLHRVKKGSSIALLSHPLLLEAASKTKATLHVIGATSVPGIVYEPLAARQAIKHADLVLIPAIAVTPEKVIAPIGSELLTELAHARGIPVYVYATGFQYARHLEVVPGMETQCYRAHGSHKTCIATYEALKPSDVTIISELGIFSHARFIDELSHAYPWLWA